MMKVMKSYEQGFRLTSKLKTKAANAPSVRGVHPVFQESDEEDVFDQPASSIIKQDVSPTVSKDATSSTSVSSEIKTLPKGHSKSPAKEKIRSPVRSGHRSRSRSRTRSHLRSHSRSRSRSKSRSRGKDSSKSHSRNYSRSPSRSYIKSRDSRDRSRSRSPRFGYYQSSHFGPRTHIHSRHSREKDIPYDGDRWRKSNVRGMAKKDFTYRPRGRGQFSWKRDHRDARRGHSNIGSHDLPEPLSDQERKAVIEAARQRLEAQIKFGTVDWDEHSPHPKPQSRCESSYPKTPSRSESSRPRTPSRWDSSHPKTPSSWESSRPKTPSRWDSSRPKTPSRWDSSHSRTSSRWDTSRPKTPSRWDVSHPKTPSRCSATEPKTPGRWRSNSLERIESSDEDSQSHTHGGPSPDRGARFGKWDSDEKGKIRGCKIGTSLSEMETFVEAAKQKKLEEMKERNKEFLKPNVD